MKVTDQSQSNVSSVKAAHPGGRGRRVAAKCGAAGKIRCSGKCTHLPARHLSAIMKGSESADRERTVICREHPQSSYYHQLFGSLLLYLHVHTRDRAKVSSRRLLHV